MLFHDITIHVILYFTIGSVVSETTSQSTLISGRSIMTVLIHTTSHCLKSGTQRLECSRKC